MKRFLLVLLCVLPASLCLAQKPEDPDWVKEFAHKRIVYSLPGMERVKTRRNLIYKNVGVRDLLMDVYLPRVSRTQRVPAVLFIHGGRVPANLLTTPKDWGAYVSFGQLVAAAGFAGITFNHRFHTWESLTDSQTDIRDAINYVRTHANELQVDRDRIVLWVVSAGGIFLSEPLRNPEPFIKCLVGYYPELNLQNARQAAPPTVSDQTLRDFSPVAVLESIPVQQSTEDRVAEAKNADRSRPELNPVDNVRRRVPPIFLARAGLDDAEINDGVDLFVKLALERNLTLELMTHPTGHHGFDVEDNNDRSREILRRTLEFIREHSRQ